ncbi:hypothetical protein INT47_003643 [Mucor saturninus]|uniref:Uncharacterized protein n=1 Tax=Mucor saturninus TaxID=64648 RepID=A0A8H7RBQ8_9FUNG|nr:hypothetical protein INT47_003643 [Mucor saturninus]
MHVWQWTFIIQGSPCVIIALIISWYLPNDVKTAKFLVVQEQNIIMQKLKDDVGILNCKDWSWDQFGTVLLDSKTYAFTLIYLLGAASVQGVTLFLPTAISRFHFAKSSVLHTQLLMLPPYILAIFISMSVSYSSDRYYERSYHLIGTNVVSMAALIVLLLPIPCIYTGYITTCILTATVYAHVPIKVTWITNNFTGFTRRTVALGVIISLGSVGSAIGSQVFYDPPNYIKGKALILVFLVLQSLMILLTRYCFDRENMRRKKLGMDDKAFQAYKYNGEDLAGDRHPDFRYTI